MPSKRSKANTNATPVKTEEPPKAEIIEPEEQVDFDEDVEEEEEEIEYEEVEEEVEVEEDEDEEEVEEDEDEPEEEDDDDDDEMENDETEKDVKKQHDELLALPPYGSEVYLGGIPSDATEKDLKEFCESIGEVTEVRIMGGKDSRAHKGYAFVTFRTPDLASTAIKELNNKDLKGRRIKCSTSQSKHKLFIGNIPKNWTMDNLEKVVKRVGPGVNCVELLKDPHNSKQNRGFGFIEYYNNACAEYSRHKMSNPEFKLDDRAPTVSWADPKNTESSASSQVKAVYVKNLPKDVTQEQLEKIFSHHGKIMKVVLPPAKPGHERSRFGFVHFADRSTALNAIKDTEKYELNGQTLECSLAKPQTDQKSTGGSSNSNKSAAALLPNHSTARAGYGLAGGAYGVLGAAAFPQPLLYGRGPSTAGVAMMPMLLPDGRIGYVLQQPGVPPHTPQPPPQQQRGGGGNRSGGGSGSSGGHRRGGGGSSGGQRRGGNDNGSRGRSRYNPY